METNEDVCKACGKCCGKHWLLRLTGRHEKEFFKDSIVFEEFIWTDECPHRKDDKCGIYGHDHRPSRCGEYFCEGREINGDTNKTK